VVNSEAEVDRRHQARVAVQIAPERARRWFAGAWHDIEASIVDVSSRGLGLRLKQGVTVGDRLSLVVPLNDGEPDLRVTVELRHVRADHKTGTWRAGGLFKTLAPTDHDRLVRFVSAESQAHQRL
jgi:c-di-GMP-binding flagellar brake protein YcgR